MALKIGLAVGLPLGLLLLATIAYLVWELRKQKAVAEELKTMVYQDAPGRPVSAQQMATPKYMYQGRPQQHFSELPHHEVAQLPTGPDREELDASPRL